MSHPRRKLVVHLSNMVSRAYGPSGYYEARRPPRARTAAPAPQLCDPAPEPVIVRTLAEDRRLRTMHWVDCALRLGVGGFAAGMLFVFLTSGRF